MTENFKDVARRIEANPLGRLMYGQRELFHSNLIGWFFDQLPEAADTTFRPLASPGANTGHYVERERGHMDLVFHWPDRAPLVIEKRSSPCPTATSSTSTKRPCRSGRTRRPSCCPPSARRTSTWGSGGT